MSGMQTQAGVAQYFSPDKSRGSIYFKDGVASDGSFYIQGQTNAANTLVLNKWTGVKNNVDPYATLKAKNFDLLDKYGGTQKMRFQTSYSQVVISSLRAFSLIVLTTVP